MYLPGPLAHFNSPGLSGGPAGRLSEAFDSSRVRFSHVQGSRQASETRHVNHVNADSPANPVLPLCPETAAEELGNGGNHRLAHPSVQQQHGRRGGGGSGRPCRG